jgi:hypothetical protein
MYPRIGAGLASRPRIGAEVHGGSTLNTWMRHFFTCVSPFLLHDVYY